MLWAQALEDPEIVKMIVQKLRQVATNPRTVVHALESAARINRELGWGAEGSQSGVTIIMNTNIDPQRLRAGRHTVVDPAKLRRRRDSKASTKETKNG